MKPAEQTTAIDKMPVECERSARMLKLFEAQSNALRVERKRIAVALHDDLQQPLFAVLMRLNAMRSENKNVQFAESLDAASRSTRDVIDLMRRLGTVIYPPILQYGELSNILVWLVSELKTSRDLTIYYGAQSENRRMAEKPGYLLYDGVRELLIRVSEAFRLKEIWMKARNVESEVEIVITAKGIDPDIPEMSKDLFLEGGSIKLLASLELLEAEGGAVSFNRAPEQCFQISIRLPVDERG